MHQGVPYGSESCLQVSAHTHICTHTHARTHTRTHTQAHTYTQETHKYSFKLCGESEELACSVCHTHWRCNPTFDCSGSTSCIYVGTSSKPPLDIRPEPHSIDNQFPSLLVRPWQGFILKPPLNICSESHRIDNHPPSLLVLFGEALAGLSCYTAEKGSDPRQTRVYSSYLKKEIKPGCRASRVFILQS